MAHIHFDTETLIKALRCLQGQVTLILNRSADVIRKSAVGVRNKTGTLKDYDFSFLVKPAYSCRCSRAAGNTAYYYNFHLSHDLSSVRQNAADILYICVSHSFQEIGR